MRALNGKLTGDSLPATDWNDLPTEVQNVITDTGQTLSSGDLDQLGKAIADYVANGSFFVDSGLANAYVLSAVGSKQNPTAYTDGLVAEFIAGNASTTSSTIQIGGLGIKNIANTTVSGSIKAGGRYKIRYRTSSGNFELIEIGAPAQTGSSSMWHTSAPPPGWLEMDGSSLSRTVYAALFAILGVTYGNVDGNTFNIPDLRGEFPRGWANGSTNDPDRATRANRGDGTAGDNIGTKQAWQIESHNHALQRDSASGSLQSSVQLGTTVTGTTTTAILSAGGNQTNPININVMFIIKY